MFPPGTNQRLVYYYFDLRVSTSILLRHTLGKKQAFFGVSFVQSHALEKNRILFETKSSDSVRYINLLQIDWVCQRSNSQPAEQSVWNAVS